MLKVYWPLFFCLAFTMGCTSDTDPEMARAQSKGEDSKKVMLDPHYTVRDFDTVALTPIALAAYDISIARPVYWQDTSTANLWVCHKPCPVEMDTTDFCPNFVINHLDRDPDIALTEYADTIIARLQRRPEIEDFRFIEKAKQTVNGLPVLTVDYKAVAFKRYVGGTSVLVGLPTKVVIITFMGPNYPPQSFVRYRGLYERIIRSIEPI